jgi:hypothetical protein
MKTKNLFTTGLMAFAMIAFTACGGADDQGHNDNGDHNEHMNSDSTGHMHSDGADHMHEAHAAAYQCPMKCEGDKTYAEAGRCPVCNMDLKEVE